MAKRIYNLASNKKFIQGRKTRHVVAVILYTVCRIQKTRHLLIDFSDTLQTNLYVLGSIYLKLIRLLQISVPLIDPSLFIHRFCVKLEFTDKTKLVSNTALRILSSMSRDWMTVGRRPSGLCGAAILISARYHGFKRTTQQIVEVVNVCDETIRKRLEEFSNTPVARLTKVEFEALKFSDEQGMDPPAYIKNKKCSKKKVNIADKAKEIEKIFEEDEKSTYHGKLISNIDTNLVKKESETIFYETVPFNNFYEIKHEMKKEEENEDLSDIDDKEMSKYILTPEEYKLKKLLWEVLFKDWIEDQKSKDHKVKPKTMKKRSRKVSRADTVIAKTPVEAIKNNSDKLKNKNLNFKLLESLFQK
jgi:transcription factor IIIB subunit 2